MDEEAERTESLAAQGQKRFAIGKSEAVPVVLQWLENNYEQHSDASTPKHDVYNEYSDFCQRHQIEPTSSSAFGRLVRLAFPATTSRRLGARGSNVTVYNHFRRRLDTDHRSYPLSSGSSSSSSDQPPSPSTSLNSLDGDYTRLRGGGSSKGDGRAPSVEDLKHGRTSSINGPSRYTSFDSEPLRPDEDEPGERIYHKPNSAEYDLGDGLIDLPQRMQSTCTTPSSGTLASIVLDEEYDALTGDVASGGANLLMKMLKSEENGAELYDSLHRMLYGGRAITSVPLPYRRDGMDLESEADGQYSSNPSGKQLQLYRGPQSPPPQERKPGLWNADTHLHLMKLCETYRDCYSHNLWLLNPLHPAALEDDNIRYIMCSDEGAEERSPLSLSIYWILYSGALMSGHIERAKEFYSKAREHLGHVFDQTDSSISLVLLPMAYHSRFWAATEEEGVTKCAYYLTLALEICKRIGCLGSSVYISCLQMYAWFCMTDTSSITYENVYPIYEKLQEVKKGSYYPTMPVSLQTAAIPRNAKTSVHIPISHLQMVEKMFGVVGNIMKGIFIFKSTVQPEPAYQQRSTFLPYSDRSYAPSQQQQQQHQQQTRYSHKRKHSEEVTPAAQSQQSMASSEDQRRRPEHTLPEHAAKHRRRQSDSVAGDQQQQQQQQRRSSEGHHGQQHCYEHQYEQQQQRRGESVPHASYRNLFRPNTTLQPLLLPLETMEQDLELLMKSDNPLPFNIYMMFKLWIVGERAECYWCMGQPREAVQTALYFLDVSKRSTKNFISHYVSIQPILEMVLNVFLATSRLDDFRALVDAILEPLDPNIPHVARSKARFYSALFAANPVFSTSTDIDASPSSASSASASAMAQLQRHQGSGSDSPESANGGSFGGSSGRSGSGSDESPASFGGNDSGEETSEQMMGLARAS